VTTGAGLRAWGLSEGLRHRGFDVIIASPALEDGASGPLQLPPHVRACPRSEIGAMIAEVRPSVVVLQHWGMAADVPELTVPLALDLAGPHLLERLFWGDNDTERNVAEKIAALRRADFVTCSGEYQRHYFYPFLAMAGFDLRENCLAVIPFSVPPDAAAAATTARRDPLAFVYGGAFLAWQDPTRPPEWLLEELDHAGRGTLHFFGGAHPVADASGGRFASLMSTLREHPRVIVRGLVAFDDLLTAYRKASVALDLMARNPERELAFTTRTMIYLYCGLPVMYNNYSEISGIVRDRGCGWTLDPEDETGFRRAVRSVLDGTAPLDAMRRAALMTATDYSWDKTIGPLAEFCANPRQREGRVAISLAVEARRREADALRDERDALRSELLSIKGRLSYRLLQRLPALGVLAAPFAYLAGWVLAGIVYLRLRRTTR